MVGWTQQTKADYTYDILIQAEEADCGLCCCAMVAHQLGHGKPTSRIVGLSLPSGAYQKSTRDRPGMTLVMPGADTNAYHSQGTYVDSLSQALKNGFGISNTAVTNQPGVGGAITAATKQRPVIVLVNWTSGEGHWVVIAENKGASQIILDPYFGLGINSSSTNYCGLQQGASAGTVALVNYGAWQPFWLQVD